MDPASVYDLLFISDSADEHHNRVLTSIHFRSERGYPGSGVVTKCEFKPSPRILQ